MRDPYRKPAPPAADDLPAFPLPRASRRPLVALAAGLALGVAIGGELGCLSPAAQEKAKEAAPAIPVIERASCVLLRAMTTSGTLDEVCATADDLAPLVPGLLAARAESRKVAPADAPHVAAVMAMPSHAVPRRRCAQWAPVAASKDGNALDASGVGDGQ